MLSATGNHTLSAPKRTAVSWMNTHNVIRMLTDMQLPRSREIIDALKDHPGGLTVTEIMNIVKPTGDPYVDQPTISQALAKLRRHKILSVTKQGKHRYYKINIHRIAQIVRSVNQLLYGHQ